jgi:uncharacterized membrane protein YbhN (UPF0104 family)
MDPEARVDHEPTDSDVRQGADRDAHRLRRGVVWTVGLAALLTGVGLAVPDLRHVLDRVTHAEKGWLVLAVALEIASCLGYVIAVRLVLSRGPAREIRRLAWAEMAFGAVVPLGGAGSLAVGAWAMRAWGVPWSRVANRSAVIFLLTSAVNATVLAVSGFGVWLGIGADKGTGLYGLIPGLFGALAFAVFWALPRWRALNGGAMRGRKLEPVLQRTATWVSDTEAVAFQRNWRVLGAIGYLLFDIAVLWACLRAVGESAPVLALVLGYQIGYLANLIPIPGAVGALDGGLLGALVIYGLPAAPTAAAIVLYHAIALVIPTVGGTVAFAALRRSFTGQDGYRAPQPPAALPAPVPVAIPAPAPVAIPAPAPAALPAPAPAPVASRP